MKKVSQLTVIAFFFVASLSFLPSKALANDPGNTYGTDNGKGNGGVNNGNGSGNNGNNGNNGNGHGGGETTMPINNGLLFLTIAGLAGGILVLRKNESLVKA